MCSRASHEDTPDMWLKGAILPFHRRGDLGSASNNRAVGVRIYIGILLDRLRPHIDPKLRNDQNSFRKGRSTVAQILTLRRLVERIKSQNLPAIINFVDFHKAFDSIHMGKLIEILKAFGVPEEIVDAVNMMYTITTV